MKERPSGENTPRIEVKITHELPYETFSGSLEKISVYVNGLINDKRWEGIEVSAIHWGKSATYQLYGHRMETDTEYNNRLKGLQGQYDYKLRKLKELQDELIQWLTLSSLLERS